MDVSLYNSLLVQLFPFHCWCNYSRLAAKLHWAMDAATTPEPDAAWLDPVEMRAWRAVLVAQSRLFARLDDELSTAHGLSLADYEVLAQLSETPGGVLRMSELARRCLVSRSGLTRRVDGLVAAGLVLRRECPSDHRGTLAQLTGTGRLALVEAARTHVAGVRRHLVDRLSRQQLETLAEALEASG